MRFGGLYLENEVGYERVSLVISQIITLLSEHGEERAEILQCLIQHTRVRLKETQSEPLQDEVNVADSLRSLRFQGLRKHTSPGLSYQQNKHGCNGGRHIITQSLGCVAISLPWKASEWR